MVASIILIALDQGIRLGRTIYLHFGGRKGSIGFRRAMANVQMIGEGDDAVVRLDFDFEQKAWKPGQHFYLCFPELSIWQSHPFTVTSMPSYSSKTQHHTYLLRARKGQTAQLAALAGRDDVAVVMSGPYGHGWPRTTTDNVLAVAGGTGVTFTLPIATASLRQFVNPQATVDFVWVIRHASDLLWLSSELHDLKEMLAKNSGLRISIFVTREDAAGYASLRNDSNTLLQESKDPEKGITISATASSSEKSSATTLSELLATTGQERFSVEMMGGQHPSMEAVVASFMERAKARGGCIQVVGSGPESMGSDLRAAISDVNTNESLNIYWDSRE
jgi:ferric-chelate reductase